MDSKDWLIIMATIMGPILAVQAQKAVERFRERRNRKAWVFHTLMATRAARLAGDHVQALNMIDLAFYGTRFFWKEYRTNGEQAVLDAWHEYHDHLGDEFDDKTFPLWNAKGDELFTNLLVVIGKDVGYKFDRVQLKKGSYSPKAHGNYEYEQNKIRELTLKVLSRESAIDMNVVGLPINEEILKAQIELQKKLASSIDESGAFTVKIQNPPPAT
jgi:hypothetical protein